MENAIRYNYGLNFTSFKHDQNFVILTDDEHTYYLIPYTRPVDDLKDIYYVTEELIKRNVATHSFVLNNKNHLLTKIDNTDYVMLRINYLELYEFSLNEINILNKLSTLNDDKSKLYRNNWGELWSTKVDYLEYQLSELGHGKKLILNSFSYYIGLAENAISYVNQVNKIFKEESKSDIVLSRKRIYSPNYAVNYLNPLNYIFDIEVRDLAEYIKSMFFNDIDVWSEIDDLFKTNHFTPYLCHMFYARLLYPSYYFDKYQDIMDKDNKEEELIYIINKNEDWEDFLQDMFYYLNNFTHMIPINWLIKK